MTQVHELSAHPWVILCFPMNPTEEPGSHTHNLIQKKCFSPVLHKSSQVKLNSFQGNYTTYLEQFKKHMKQV